MTVQVAKGLWIQKSEWNSEAEIFTIFPSTEILLDVYFIFLLVGVCGVEGGVKVKNNCTPLSGVHSFKILVWILKINSRIWVYWCAAVIPGLRRRKWECHKFEFRPVEFVELHRDLSPPSPQGKMGNNGWGSV